MDRRGSDGHRYFEGLAVSHVLGGLDESEGRIFRSHLLECAPCRARVGELRAIAHELADVERDERRVRAARAIETKRREVDDDPAVDKPQPTSRATRILVLAGFALIIALAAWSFTLRSAVGKLENALDDRLEASAVMEFGTLWRVVEEVHVDGKVRVLGDELVLLVDGLDPQRVYGVYVLSGDGETIFRQAMRPTSRRLFPLIRLQQAPKTVVVTLSTDGRATLFPSGPRVFQAERPRSI